MRLVVALFLFGGLAGAQGVCAVDAPSRCHDLGPGHESEPGGPTFSWPSRVSWPASSDRLAFFFNVPPGGLGAFVGVSVGFPSAPRALEGAALCMPAILYPEVQLVLWSPPGNLGNVPVLAVTVPAALRGSGLPVALQGFVSGEPGGCFVATRGTLVEF